MTCPSCGSENRLEAKFCKKCGSPLGLTCPNGHPVLADAAFCDTCGAPVTSGVSMSDSALGATSGALAQPVRAPEAERRLVSVLFADLVGFTSLSESRDPEEVRDLLTRYFDTSRRLITLYGGTVEKFIGDAVMAVWGTPVAQEDDAERAVRAALDLTEAVGELGAQVGALDLKARAGVLTGEAAVTIGAEGQGMVAGDLVNTASRIQSAAPPGSVYVGDSTRRATDAAIAYEDGGSHELKGKSEPIPLWRAVRVIAGVGGALRSEGLEAPFVGRDRELRAVKDLFFACAEDRKAHLVSVVGVAGIGKSRLAWEFYKYFDGLPQTTWYHRGRSLAYGEGVTYWALSEMVRMRARIAEGEDAATALSKLRASIEEHVPDAEERKWIEPRLAHLIGVEDRASRDSQDLFAAWRLFFERLAETNPTVMVFEDMQWADAAVLDFIEYLLEWSRNYPIFVLTLARPELSERRPTWGSGKRNFTPIYLEPLAREEMEALLAGLVPGLPEELRDQILDRAEGVPLYAVETVRMLLDRGLLAKEGSVYRTAGPVAALEVPETLQGLIAARLDGLSAQERKVVQDASVVGKTFTKGALAAVSGVSEEDLDPALTSLVRKEVLTIQADQRSPERGQYGFLQDLMRRVAYETLPRKERKARHLAVAGYLEAAWGEDEEEIVEVVASHFLEAYREAPRDPDAGAIRSRARDMLTRAGERAASLGANREAQRYFEQALELAEEPLIVTELNERAGRMAWRGGRFAEARAHFELAVDQFRSIGLTHPAARVSAALAEVRWAEGHIEQGLEQMEAAFEVLAGEEPDEDLATLAAQLGRLLFFVGRSDDALERVEFALAIAEALRIPEVLSQGLNSKGMILAQVRGRPVEGVTLIRRALEVALENDLPSAALRGYNNLGAILANLDRWGETRELARRAVGLSRRVGDRGWELVLTGGLLHPLWALGEWDEAAATARDLLSAPDFEVVRSILDALWAAVVLAYRGELDEAERWLHAFSRQAESQDVQERAVYRVVRATILRVRGTPTDALADAEQALAARKELGILHSIVKEALVLALECAAALGSRSKLEELLGVIEDIRPGELTPYLQAHGARFGARLDMLRGQTERVEAGLVAAVSIFREISMPFWIAVTLLEHGEWLIANGKGARAEPLLSEAREIFERLKAKPWVERTAAVAGGAGAPVPAGGG